MTAPAFICLTMSRVTSTGAFRPGTCAVAITTSASRTTCGECSCSFFLLVFAHGLRIPAGRFCAGNLQPHPGRAQALYLFLYGGPNVEALNHRAQPAGSRDCLEAGNARAENQHTRRWIVPAAVINIGKNRPLATAASSIPHW